MDITGSVALVTGAHGGIGRAFVADLLKRGAAKVYVTARDTASLADLLKDGDKRLVPLALDVIDPDQVLKAAIAAPDVTLLINNAGYAAFQGAIAAPDMAAVNRLPTLTPHLEDQSTTYDADRRSDPTPNNSRFSHMTRG
jgi:NAD(P)-dependent dehydrogenase (short-subunit alcohol dehydrogenase family)